jgi:hypothetical protein
MKYPYMKMKLPPTAIPEEYSRKEREERIKETIKNPSVLIRFDREYLRILPYGFLAEQKKDLLLAVQNKKERLPVELQELIDDIDLEFTCRQKRRRKTVKRV